MTGLSGRDYERILDVVAAIFEADEPEKLWHLVSGQLAEGFRSRTVLFARLGPDGSGSAEGWAPAKLDAMDELIERRIGQRHPLLGYLVAGERQPVDVAQLCDGWRGSQMRSEAYQRFGTTDQLGLPLVGVDGARQVVVCGRAGTFRARDLLLATRIQPLLVAAQRYRAQLARLGPVAGPGVGAGAVWKSEFSLSRREFTVLALLSEGLAAQAIARRLGISPHTVNRHLERIYRKLGTRDRLSTVLLARRYGLVAG